MSDWSQFLLLAKNRTRTAACAVNYDALVPSLALRLVCAARSLRRIYKFRTSVTPLLFARNAIEVFLNDLFAAKVDRVRTKEDYGRSLRSQTL
jgi:hypothetical protein